MSKCLSLVNRPSLFLFVFSETCLAVLSRDRQNPLERSSDGEAWDVFFVVEFITLGVRALSKQEVVRASFPLPSDYF
jgi:hypothetical protein